MLVNIQASLLNRGCARSCGSGQSLAGSSSDVGDDSHTNISCPKPPTSPFSLSGTCSVLCRVTPPKAEPQKQPQSKPRLREAGGFKASGSGV